MANSADPDQLASEEVNWSGSTLFAKGIVYPGSAGQGLKQKVLHWIMSKLCKFTSSE